MSRIRVDNIIVKDFKRIRTQEINLNSITALVGGNTSGKSSVLQAAQLCIAIMQASYVGKKRHSVEKLGTLANEAVSYRPTELLLSLRHGESASQTKSFSMGYTCTKFNDDGTEARMQLEVAVTRGKNANLALRYTGNTSLLPILGDRDNPFSIFTPGLSGIPLREEWRTRGVLDAAAMHGDANLYLRTLLDHLIHKNMTDNVVAAWRSELIDIDRLPPEAPWFVFSTLLDKCYPGARIYIKHDREKDRYISVTVKYLGQSTPLDMASTGMLQVIQILAYACFYHPPLLLLDEPDAHLHADSQTRLFQALKGLTETTNTRIVLATHSPQLIQLMLNDQSASVVWMDKGAEVEVLAGQRPAIPLLMELGALTVGADVFVPANKIIILTEDSEAEMVKLFARANGVQNFACLSYNGCGNLSGARQLAVLLSELRPDAKIVIHRDRDFRTVEEMAFEQLLASAWYASNGGERIVELFTPLNDIEHSFLNLDHLSHVFNGVAVREQIETALNEAIATKRDDLTGRIRAARAVVKMELYDSDRMKRKTDFRARSGIAEAPPRINIFLPEDGTHPLMLEQCHGKTVFRAFLNKLHRAVGGDTRTFPGYILRESEHLRTQGWMVGLQHEV